jgi:PhnB protein
MVQRIPDGYHSVTPYLILDDARAAIDFYIRAFDAKELYRLPMGDRVGHAELLLGNSRIMLADEHPAIGAWSAKHYKGSPVSLLVYVEDVDAFTQKAVAAGATIVRPVQTQFYGDRSGILLDPHGYKWTIATLVEDVSPEEMNRRMQAGAAG